MYSAASCLPRDEYDTFFDTSPMKKLVEVAPQAEIKFRAT